MDRARQARSNDYRLEPENPAPAAAEDSYAPLTWTAAHAGERILQDDGYTVYARGLHRGTEVPAA